MCSSDLVDFHVPHRLRDGYGMRAEVVEEAATSGVTLIVSVDTGIRANPVVEHARGLGIDCIDVGVPQLSMHSAREMCGAEDPERLRVLVSAFLD